MLQGKSKGGIGGAGANGGSLHLLLVKVRR
jgi:hypothetical protein